MFVIVHSAYSGEPYNGGSFDAYEVFGPYPTMELAEEEAKRLNEEADKHEDFFQAFPLTQPEAQSPASSNR
jgi:hypothetical protein